MTDISAAFPSDATARAAVIALEPALSPRSRRSASTSTQVLNAAFQLFTAMLVVGVGVGWPGAIVLTLVFLVAANAAVTATIEFHAVFTHPRRNADAWLRFVGAAALTTGVVALLFLDGVAAIIPVIAAGWCAARARTGWLFTFSAALLAVGLVLLTGYGAQHAAPFAFVAVQAVSSGAYMIALLGDRGLGHFTRSMRRLAGAARLHIPRPSFQYRPPTRQQ